MSQAVSLLFIFSAPDYLDKMVHWKFTKVTCEAFRPWVLGWETGQEAVTQQVYLYLMLSLTTNRLCHHPDAAHIHPFAVLDACTGFCDLEDYWELLAHIFPACNKREEKKLEGLSQYIP